jgi:hypothetical protein
MRLKKAQIVQLLTLIGEGLKTDEINKKAGEFDPPFKVSRQQVDGYRKRRGIDIYTIIKEGEVKGLTEGLATKERRVQALKLLGEKMQNELMNDPHKFWVRNVKGIGRGDDYQEVEYFEFNASEVRELRETLADIAMEVGDRGRDKTLLPVVGLEIEGLEEALKKTYGPQVKLPHDDIKCNRPKKQASSNRAKSKRSGSPATPPTLNP